VPDILVVSDAPSVLADVRSVLEDGETSIRELRAGRLVRQSVEEDPPDLVVTDFQVGSMGGMAICMDLRLEETGGRLPHVPVLMLVDRRADVFLAKRSDAEGWLVKPLDPLRLRRAARRLLEGGTYHDDSYKPLPLLNDQAAAMTTPSTGPT
jgi:CheY-like chemotaxis protein